MDVVHADDPDALARATAALDAGQLVIIPGDLHYLLVADALNDEAVDLLFTAVNRPADRPVTVCVGGYEDHQHVAFGTPAAQVAAVREWPGPATLVLRARPWVPEAVTAGGDQVRVSAPRQPFANALARHFGPYACVSARHGADARPRAVRDAHAAAELAIDAGDLPGGEAKLIRGDSGGEA